MNGNRTTHAYSHARRSLNLDAVLELVAARCANERPRREVRALRPSGDRAAIAESLAEIEEYRRRRERLGDLPVGDTGCRVDVERISSNESVSVERFLAIAAAERAAREVRSALATEEDSPRLTAVASGIAEHGALIDAIERAVDSDGSIKDSASQAIRAIRRDMQGLRGSLRALSEKLVGQYGDESLGSVLGSRFVLVVPRGKIRKGTGLVHSTSHTGGSLYFEPFALVERNNDLEARVADEKAEEARIVEELRARIRACAGELIENLDAMDRLDAIRAKARFCDEFRCTTPTVSTDGCLRLVGARHPVLERLLAGAGGEPLVPLELDLERDRRVLVITGPNAGGKTVALKTVGVAAMLFQCGIQPPCGSGSELPVFERVFADIGDEQSLESSLSTFTSHLKNLDAMSRRADGRTLCLIDEIGDGTDPEEGAALAISTLEKLLRSGAVVIATTHYGRIKTFALQAAGVANASMAFEDTEGKPLYRLLQGVAGRSRGLETARRAGFDPAVIERARSYVGEEAFQLESVLAELESTIRALEGDREAVARRSDELERLLDSYREKSAAYDMTKGELTRKAAREAQGLLRETRKTVERLVRSIRERGADAAAIRETHATIDEMMARALKAERKSAPRNSTARGVSPGARVSLNPAGSPAGVVTEVNAGIATVEIGAKRIKIRIDALYEAAPATRPAPSGGVHNDYRAEALASTTLDVRGRDREEALGLATHFLDQAVLTGVSEVKIIHGVGTGVLSRAINELLRDDDRVESARTGESIEGGRGVTIVRLKG